MILRVVWNCFGEIKKWIYRCMPQSKWQSAEWTLPKVAESATDCWQGYGIHILGCAWNLVYQWSWKGKTVNNNYCMAQLNHLKEEITKKHPHMQRKKVIFHQDNAPVRGLWLQGKILRITLSVASTPILSSRFGTQWLLPACIPEKKCLMARD